MTVEGPRAEPRSARRQPRGRRARTPLLIGGLAVVAVVAVLVWRFAGGGDDEDQAEPRRATAAGMSLQKLRATAATIPHPVYWAGPRQGQTYEFSQTKDGRTYVRYLPEGTKVGSPRGDFLTVGTYPQEKAFDTLKATAKKQGAATIELRAGGIAFQDENRPTSVYAAYPGSDYQVEVFEPSGGRALRLVKAGKLTALAKPASRTVSAAELRALADELGHPIYWAGADPESTYELTRTRDGRVYVRYLPPGVRAGDSRADYLTVGTYPQRNAVAQLKARAARLQVTTIDVPEGGFAYIDKDRPTSAYIAYPGLDLQVEIYAPDSQETEDILTGRRIRPVG
jgi:hypothetical protein